MPKWNGGGWTCIGIDANRLTGRDSLLPIVYNIAPILENAAPLCKSTSFGRILEVSCHVRAAYRNRAHTNPPIFSIIGNHRFA